MILRRSSRSSAPGSKQAAICAKLPLESALAKVVAVACGVLRLVELEVLLAPPNPPPKPPPIMPGRRLGVADRVVLAGAARGVAAGAGCC